MQLSRSKITKRIISALLSFIMVMTVFSGASIFAAGEPLFTDLDTAHWSYPYIETMYEQEVLRGFRDGSFGPNKTLNRAQVAQMMVLATDINYEGLRANFKDVPSGHSYEPYIGAAAENGIVKGYANGNFGMYNPVSRRHIASFVVRTFGLKEGEVETNFTDTAFPTDPEASENIRILASNGIVKGYNNNTEFRPSASATRAQFSKIMTISMAVAAVQRAESTYDFDDVNGAQELIYTLTVDDTEVKDGLQNRLNVVKRAIGALDVVGINAVNPIRVEFGDEYHSKFPYTVSVKLSNGTSDDIWVDWDEDVVDYYRAGTYSVKGTLQAQSSWDGIVETDLTAEVKVTVKPDSTQPVVSAAALQRAKDYLRYSTFSREGLIGQIEFEGYSRGQAVYAVNNSGANWKANALAKAKRYINNSGFSQGRLLGQLRFEQYTIEEATYAVQNCGADWLQEAVERALSYQASRGYTREKMIHQLIFEEFTPGQAAYGATTVGLN